VSGSGFGIDLTGKIALVTGGTRGIGLSASRFFARAGAAVAMVYRSRKEEAKAALAQVSTGGARARAIRADISREKDCERAVRETIRSLGGLHFLVNNAGIWPGGNVEDIPVGEWDEAFAVNMRGTFLATKLAVPVFKKQGFGRIVNVSSTAGQRGEAGHSHYAATKGAVISFTKSLATELGPSGITVNAVAPGWVDTEMSASELSRGKRRREIEEGIPTRRVSTADDIGAAIVFLCSEYARNINGEILNINGGSVLAG
jgi:3-oxoacyl-[acyl-carrier protein] reductase